MPLPTFSITIEWENARFAELVRTRRMLRELRAQLIELAPPVPPEILFLYSPGHVPEALVRDVIAEGFHPQTVPAVTRIVATDNLRYYEQKNYGAQHSGGDIKVFLDSDVVPERGWLRSILESFEKPEVGAVGGQTYLEFDSFYTKAFALFWVWQLRDPAEGLVPARLFYANNVAFRADVFAACPFPDLPTNRDQCTVLARELSRRGIGLYLQKSARVSHPPPRGFWNFVKKAVNDGRDQALMRADQRLNTSPWRGVYWNFRNGLVRSYRRFRTEHRKVRLGPIGAVAGYGLAVAWYALRALGEGLTLVRPSLVPRYFPV
jgi:hypothetical protein